MSQLNAISIEEERKVNDLVFPLTLAPPAEPASSISDMSATLAYLDANMTEIKAKLLAHRAILFRGFPVAEPKDFNDFVLRFQWDNLPYVGGAAVRNQVYGVVFTSNESPPDQPIPFHHEMAQTPKFPYHLGFFCQVAPKRGGQTPLCVSNSVYEAVNAKKPHFVRKLIEKQVRYTRIMPGEDDPTSPIGRSWRSTYLTQDKKEAEEKCVAAGGTFEWLPNDCLKSVSALLPAIKEDPRTSKLTWFNSIVAVYYGWKDARNTPQTAITYGDGEPLDHEDVECARDILDEMSVAFKWQQGDVLIVDNRQALHSRIPFEPPRKILAALFR